MSSIIEQPRFSCALASQHTVLAIPGALPIVHAGPGCASKTFNFLAGQAGSTGEGFGGGAHISSTNTTEKDVVFGGEGHLRSLVSGALKVMDAEMFVILSGCTSGIIGDDIQSVASDYRDEGHTVIAAETSGFKGNNYFGHELVINEIIEQLLEDAEPEVRKGLVNVFSVVPNQDPFWRGDLEEIKRLLEKLGLTVNILFGNGSKGVAEWRDIPNAEYNIVINPWVGLSTAKLLQRKFGTPYFHYAGFPVGARATSDFLRQLSKALGLDQEKTEAVIAQEEGRFYDYIVSLADFLTEFRNNIPTELFAIGDSAYTLGTTDFLVNELGFDVRGVYAVDQPKGKTTEELVKNAALALDGGIGEKFVFEADAGKIQMDLKEKIGDSHKAIILGSTWEDQLARNTGNLLIHLSIPIIDDVIITRSFFGYSGGLRLAEEIYAGIYRKGKIAVTTQTLH